MTWLRSFGSLLEVCWVSVGIMICGIHGIRSASKAVILMGSPNGLSKKSSPNELSKLRPDGSPLGIHWSFQCLYVFLAQPVATFATS